MAADLHFSTCRKPMPHLLTCRSRNYRPVGCGLLHHARAIRVDATRKVPG
jgi:hypothetical protein